VTEGYHVTPYLSKKEFLPQSRRGGRERISCLSGDADKQDGYGFLLALGYLVSFLTEIVN
jgi:hypothetical protein